MSRRVQQNILIVIASVAFAFTYIAMGFSVVAGFPFVTQSLSQMNSQFNVSAYEPESLVQIAVDTRDFTAEDYGRDKEGVEAAENKLAEKILEGAKASIADGSPTESKWTPAAKNIVETSENDESALVTLNKLAAIDEKYALNQNSFSHLNDVNYIVQNVRIPIAGITTISIFCLLVAARMFGRKACGYLLIWSGLIVLAIFAVLGLWTLLSFDSLFTMLHRVLFAEGSWLFPADSLLICMYPLSFWMGMAGVWLAVTCLLAVISFACGMVLLYKKPKMKTAPETHESSSNNTDNDSAINA